VTGPVSTEDQVLEFLRGVLPPDAPPLSGDTSLFDGGLLDSLALLHLLLWVEGQTGKPLDPRTFNLREQWSVVSDVARFVDGNRSP
jgi:acyl carrier protein